MCFKIDTLQSVLSPITPVRYLIKLDLRDAYYYVPIHRDHIKFLKFICKNQLQFLGLPNGLAYVVAQENLQNWWNHPYSRVCNRRPPRLLILRKFSTQDIPPSSLINFKNIFHPGLSYSITPVMEYEKWNTNKILTKIRINVPAWTSVNLDSSKKPLHDFS